MSLWLAPLHLTDGELAIIRTIRNVRQYLLEYWPGSSSTHLADLDVTLKVDHTLVTAADYLSDQTVTSSLAREFPTIPVISEECEEYQSIDHSTFWILDPLDGTQAFVCGSPDFAVLLSLRGPQGAIFSIVDYPASPEMVVAKGLAVAFDRDISTTTVDRSSARVIHTVYFDATDLNLYCPGGFNYQKSSVESTRVLLEVAKGTVDAAVVRVCGHKIWDIAALDHILRACGRTFTDESGNALEYSTIEIRAKYLVASRTLQLQDTLLHLLSL